MILKKQTNHFGKILRLYYSFYWTAQRFKYMYLKNETDKVLEENKKKRVQNGEVFLKQDTEHKSQIENK